MGAAGVRKGVMRKGVAYTEDEDDARDSPETLESLEVLSPRCSATDFGPVRGLSRSASGDDKPECGLASCIGDAFADRFAETFGESRCTCAETDDDDGTRLSWFRL